MLLSRLTKRALPSAGRRPLSTAANEFGAYGRQPPPGAGLVNLRDLLPRGWSERGNSLDDNLVVAAACVTPFEMNQYVVGDKASGQSVVIDSGGDDSEGMPEVGLGREGGVRRPRTKDRDNAI